jgi:DNA-binding LacI/PurR family transcriptional regulator
MTAASKSRAYQCHDEWGVGCPAAAAGSFVDVAAALGGGRQVVYCIDPEGFAGSIQKVAMKPTLQTVADALGVSRSTVSNAYGRPDQLSPELRAKILETAGQLGYSGPNPTARSLRLGSVGAIGVLFTATLSYAFTDPYAVQFLRGLSEVADRHGTGLLIVPLPAEDDEAAVRAVKNAAVDGFCVYCVNGPDWSRLRDVIRSRGLPMVGTEQQQAGEPGVMSVTIDERAATRAAAAHLTQFGHRRVAVICDWVAAERRTGPISVVNPDDLPYYTARERLRGYRDSLAEAGVGWADVTVVSAASNSRAAGAAAAAYVLDRADRPTAVLAITDMLALGVIDALSARGLRPGREVSVVGFDDIPEADAAHLSTIRQPALEKGRIAGQLLLDPPDDPSARQVVLPTELMVRASTGPAPADQSLPTIRHSRRP